MRNPINVLYYPDFYLDQTTLMTAILLFDELHFMDRPALTFGGRDSAFGTMGADSPLWALIRHFASLRNRSEKKGCLCLYNPPQRDRSAGNGTSKSRRTLTTSSSFAGFRAV